MKLPEDKAEKTKVLGLIGIGVAATIYVIVRYAAMPIAKTNQRSAKRIAEIADILTKADMEVKLIHRDKEANAEALKEIKRISDTYLLHPSMGINYQIPATKVIDRIKQVANLKTAPPQVGPGGKIPGFSLPAKSNIRQYGMNMSLDCSFASFVRLLAVIRKENPYIAISGISISAREKTPELHRISFLVSWPVWVDPKMVDRVKEQVVEEKKPEGGGTS